MDKAEIINLLSNSGLKVFGMDSEFVYFQDPSCIFPAFDIVLEYAWLAILIMLTVIIIGWGALYIKNGVKIDTLFHNVKTLVLILGTLAVVKPVVNIVYGDDLFAKQCEVKEASLAEVKNLVDLRDKKLGKTDANLFENFNIIDSGPVYSEITYTDQDD